jgi:hypothetical protein
MPGLSIQLVYAIRAIFQIVCLAMILDCAHLFAGVYGRHSGSEDELNSIIQMQNLSAGQ